MNQFNMQLELQHIYLEVYNERFHNLKEYCEAYYCYKHNLVTRHGKPDWLGIFTTANYSLKAQQCSDRKLLSRDLWLPMTVIIGQLKALVRDDQATIANIQDLLDAQLDYVIVTREEYKRLVNKGLDKSMPKAYYQVGHSDHLNAMARFEIVGITFA
ncbi:TPA: hypothetical protein ACX6QD_001377 [Photobacterium damselae]